ncbi:MAG: heavy-metal-associated domain-containing protein [Synergistaceae bacterium]|nr:heavy-metal-associated domain-containing protein [Synergistaceae bacterium]MBP9559584.1 heavy-metal-associated domain-containing protein [Synergistaceae bacterium]MBP9974759.1 heavy-metal-associated domain-containing protein [Synergistaceae bacterium]MCE5182958.1 heavy-metal-associated domain-containing protein [Synergistaceae bacterium]MDD4750411.1 heavy-metal-associated domain-containing protein [Synergistaceae bacterium]
MKKFTLLIPEMMCGHCEKRIREAVSSLGGNVISLDLETKIVEAEADVSEEVLIKAIDDAGYEAQINN